ncbi:hypothetical protein [Alicyclobacillus fastidiosus]|uniref:Uncharacterized protein n=1 Tax=Alicyclobacillus fastidiosus TaxID=392011 RepID=A0ABV5AK46_9BACL|nr:hypothetical protein [Alicyclobacillus fastidiosus]WEH09282.1 hypothetical protein PYS47_21840 [Alicyclobacillus fastidiosus]
MQQQEQKPRQEEFDLDVESFSDREELIIHRLREFYTIDRDIRVAQEWARGDNLPYEPTVTASAPRDDDPIVRRILQQDVLPAMAQEVVNSVKSYVSPDEFHYAASYRVMRHLERIEPMNCDDEAHINIVLKLLRERYGDQEEYLELTETEKLAIKREAYILEARERLPILLERKRIIGQVMEDLKTYFPEWWTILHYKYVLRKHWKTVCHKAARDGVDLTKDEYILARRKALLQFDKWAVGLT